MGEEHPSHVVADAGPLIHLKDAESCLEGLYRVSSLFVTHAIVELAIEQLRRPE